MDTDPPGALNSPPPAATALWRSLLAIAALAWWGAFGVLIWVCFLRSGPRNLGATLDWFSRPHAATSAIACALIATGLALVLRKRASERRIGVLNLLFGAALGLPWITANALFGTAP